MWCILLNCGGSQVATPLYSQVGCNFFRVSQPFPFRFYSKAKSEGHRSRRGTQFRSSLFFPESLTNEDILVSVLKFSTFPFFTRAWIFSSCFRARVSLPWSPCTVSTSCNESKVTTELLQCAQKEQRSKTMAQCVAFVTIVNLEKSSCIYVEGAVTEGWRGRGLIYRNH